MDANHGQKKTSVFVLCLAEIKSACKIDNIQRRRVTCCLDEDRSVRNFGNYSLEGLSGSETVWDSSAFDSLNDIGNLKSRRLSVRRTIS